MGFLCSQANLIRVGVACTSARARAYRLTKRDSDLLAQTPATASRGF